MNPDKRGNPPFEPSSYAAGMERTLKRFRVWNAEAREMAYDLLNGSGPSRAAAEEWWRMQLEQPQVVLSRTDDAA